MDKNEKNAKKVDESIQSFVMRKIEHLAGIISEHIQLSNQMNEDDEEYQRVAMRIHDIAYT